MAKILHTNLSNSCVSPYLLSGIEPSPDKMLQARLFSYSDTHRHRLGKLAKANLCMRAYNFAEMHNEFVTSTLLTFHSPKRLLCIIFFLRHIFLLSLHPPSSTNNHHHLIGSTVSHTWIGTNYQSIPVNCPFATTVKNFAVRFENHLNIVPHFLYHHDLCDLPTSTCEVATETLITVYHTSAHHLPTINHSLSLHILHINPPLDISVTVEWE